MDHHFIFNLDEWLGEGGIQLSMSAEPLYFITRWKAVSSKEDPLIEYVQEVQIKGMSEVTVNHFSFFEKQEKSFRINLENNTVGKVEGKGVINPQVIGWEFKNPEVHFQGFEFYEKVSDSEYKISGEYSADGNYRTTIKGKIWKKVKK